jgi:hypothetical protein
MSVHGPMMLFYAQTVVFLIHATAKFVAVQVKRCFFIDNYSNF